MLPHNEPRCGPFGTFGMGHWEDSGGLWARAEATRRSSFGARLRHGSPWLQFGERPDRSLR